MKTYATLAAAALLLAACGGGQRPGTGPEPAPGSEAATRDSLQREMLVAWRGAQMPSVFAVIGARDRLKLTGAQVTAIDSIAEAVRVQNEPLTDSLRRFAHSGHGGPINFPSNDAQRRDFTVYLRQIGANNRHALDAIQALLTPEQQTGVCAIARENGAERFGGMRGRRGGFGGGEGGGGGGGRGGMGGGARRIPDEMRVDSTARYGVGGWPWCTRVRPLRGDSTHTDTTRTAHP
jgi:hypothetical protein